ncbi:MAG: hypothetical protein M1822_007786 [Bathelium mastoideum]|nr:MAG: hypothetical protein M1822_007786 [Bathelium mastoideum]
MPADRLLGTLLRSLQTYTDQQDTPRLLGTAGSLLTTLSNPLNVTLLTSQLLFSPAIWERPDGLQTCLRVLSLFHSAVIAKGKQQEEWHELRKEPQYSSQPPLANSLNCDEWVKAVVKGADERSERWKHLLVIGGLLIGLETREYSDITRALKLIIDSALVTATNLALEFEGQEHRLGAYCVALVINHTFPILSDAERAHLNYDRLLPVLVSTLFSSSEGLESGYFLGRIDLDVVQIQGKKFNWSSRSGSFLQVQGLASRPLVSSMGPLSRVIAHAVENVKNSDLIQEMLNNLVTFSRSLQAQWRQNKLSEVDPAEENLFLHDETLRTALPVLWRVLKSALFSTVIVLRGMMGRLLSDGLALNQSDDGSIAISVLHVLRNLYFISSRRGSDSFSHYTFVYLTAIDILNSYPIQSDHFIHEIRPLELGRIPQHPLDRCLDLYFLNTAEHFTLTLSPSTNEELLVPATSPYLVSGGNHHLLPIFEAAHSVMLAVLSAPQSAALTAQHLPFYVDALFKVFPQNLSARQFRLAFKTLIRVITPPSPLSTSQPDLPSILLELVHNRALNASQAPLEPHPAELAATTERQSRQDTDLKPLSERVVLTLALIDSLPNLPLVELEEWLPLASFLLNTILDSRMRNECRQRFWEVLNGGEMDAERSQICVAWWNTRGGRDAVLFGWEDAHQDGESQAVMSGALPAEVAKSKL